MTPVEAADLIDVISNSIKENPSQFHISIKVIGQQAISHGGIGMKISAVGGGPGSTTIGNQVSLSGPAVEIAQQRGIAEINNQANELLKVLSGISENLRAPVPDKNFIQRSLDSIRGTWVPGVIIGVVGNAVSKVVGL